MPKAALSRREQNKAEKRGRIIAAARALFAHKGFAATTTQQIADAAGVGAGTLFLYAKTKDDLLILVFRQEMIELVERAYEAARRETMLIDQVIIFFETFVAYHERDLALARALMRQLGYVANAEQRGEIGELMTSLLGRLAFVIEAASSRRLKLVAKRAWRRLWSRRRASSSASTISTSSIYSTATAAVCSSIVT
jgi:AcrR family transcriptional regulator